MIGCMHYVPVLSGMILAWRQIGYKVRERSERVAAGGLGAA